MATSSGEALPTKKTNLAAGGQLRTGRVLIRKDKTNPRRIAYLTLLLFATPPGWSLFVVGGMLVIAAVLFHGWAAGYLARAGYKEREKVLTVRGPYRHTRNPYYVAHMTMDFGFFCIAGLPLLYLFYFPVIYSVYRNWVVNEEPFLEKEFGKAFQEFKREVPRWRVRLTPATPRGHEQAFSWTTFKLNNELPRAGSHLLLLVIFTLYALFGNPWGDVDPLARTTVVGVIAGWLLVHDIYLLDAARVHTGWVWLAGVIAVGGAGFLAAAPVWESWSFVASFIWMIVGSVLGMTVALLTLPMVARASGKTLNDRVPQPMCQWYLLGLALGLLTLTLGGVWIGILVPLMLWALNLAGIVQIRPIPQTTAMGLSLLAVFGFFAGCAVTRLVT